MKHWTIGKRLALGFTAVVALILVGGLFSFVELRVIQTASLKITDDALPGVEASGQMTSLSKDVRGAILQHILSTDPAEKARLEARMSELAVSVDKVLREYERTVTPEESRLLDEIKSALKEYREVRETKVLSLSRQNKQAEAFEAFKTVLTPVMTKYFNALAADDKFNTENAATSSTHISSAISSAEIGLIAGVMAVLLISVGVGSFIVTSTNRTLRTSVQALATGAQQVVAASGQVSSAAQSLSQGASEQAASLEETSASMQEVGSMAQRNAENSRAAATVMAEVDARVHESNAALGEMLSSMSAIQESSQKVAKIIKTIDEIAFQTNILALNAAVEAARAGDAGMGFAVVADEVRSLAQRSAQAAKDTAGLIEESIATADGGDRKVSQVATTIAGITESVAKVKRLVDDVSSASHQQTQALDQVSQAMSQMEKITQTTAATAEESAAASEELNAQAEAAMSVVTSLESLVTAAKDAGTSDSTQRGKVISWSGRETSSRAGALAARQTPRKTAEEILPLETGTYGRF